MSLCIRQMSHVLNNGTVLQASTAERKAIASSAGATTITIHVQVANAVTGCLDRL